MPRKRNSVLSVATNGVTNRRVMMIPLTSPQPRPATSAATIGHQRAADGVAHERDGADERELAADREVERAVHDDHRHAGGDDADIGALAHDRLDVRDAQERRIDDGGDDGEREQHERDAPLLPELAEPPRPRVGELRRRLGRRRAPWSVPFWPAARSASLVSGSPAVRSRRPMTASAATSTMPTLMRW